MVGIGTGWSTIFLNIILLILLKISIGKTNNQNYKEIYPYYKGFKGEIKKITDKNYLTLKDYMN